MMPINRPVRAVTRDGTVINGRRSTKTPTLCSFSTIRSGCSLTKADLREYTILTTSPMRRKRYEPDELADLVAYCCR